MQLSKRQLNKVRAMGTAALCVLLIAFLFAGQVKQTFSYVQTMSGACVNTFTGDGSETPVEPPDNPDNPDTQDEPGAPDNPPENPANQGTAAGSSDKNIKTGDDFNIFSWVFLMQLSLLAFLIVFDLRGRVLLARR